MVQEHTIDIGIDLGTTNSAVAVMESGRTHVLPNVQNHQTTPSVVRIRANGGLDVGELAYARLGLDPEDAHCEFKRAMGDPVAKYLFRASGRAMSPADLSSEVLKALLGDVQRAYGLDARAAVVTVPAAFDLAQCAATQEAARLAGIVQAPLLQEPVAASLAYGYSSDRTSGSWLVFDLGGGTFDLALVGIRDGQLHVIDHEGDNFLGGKDFDWLIVERMLLPALAREYDVRSLSRGNDGRRREMAVLKAKAEELKIALSATSEFTATIESGRVPLTDDRGREISADIVVTRDELEQAISERLDQAISLSRRLLARNEGAIDSVLLVGGPTQMPVVRRRVADELGVALNASINPMTAVAEGAALFAASQPLSMTLSTGAASVPSAEGATPIDIRHAAVTDDSETPVAVRVPAGVASAAEIVAEDGSWFSGVLPLASGAMVTRVPLRVRGANTFRVRVVDGAGREIPASPSRFSIHRGLTAAAPPLSRSIGVVLREEGTGRKTVDWLLKKDTALPARASYEFRTALALEPGGEVEVVGVYLVEGEAMRPDRNRTVGKIEITDREVSRTVPAGAPIEVRLEVSASRLLKAQVFLPSTDQTFDVEVQVESTQPTVADLTASVLREQQRIDDSVSQLGAAELVRLNEQAESVVTLVRGASDRDPGAVQQAMASLRTLQEGIDAIDDRVAVPLAIADGRETLTQASRTVSSYGSEGQQRRLQPLGTALDRAITTEDLAEIERATAKIDRLRYEVLGAQPWFWKEWFQFLATEVRGWKDPAEADRLVRQGTNAIQAADLSALKRCTLSLVALAPEDERSFANVGLRRG